MVLIRRSCARDVPGHGLSRKLVHLFVVVLMWLFCSKERCLASQGEQTADNHPYKSHPCLLAHTSILQLKTKIKLSVKSVFKSDESHSADSSFEINQCCLFSRLGFSHTISSSFNHLLPFTSTLTRPCRAT